MIANPINLLQFINNARQFVIPIYQRKYSWKLDQCQQLWDDILRSGKNDTIKNHFIGSVVYITNPHVVGITEPLIVIDGQQRLATVTLFIAALAQHFIDQNIDNFCDLSADILREYYLINRLHQGDLHYKLILSEIDKETLLFLLGNGVRPQEISTRINDNFRFFKRAIDQHKDQLESICNGLKKLLIVQIALDRTADDPQLIFESMNSTGLDLSQADLIRNYILMDLEQEQQNNLYTYYWKQMETAFGQDAYVTHFDSFMRHYLTVKTGDIPNVRDIYKNFKYYARNYSNGTRTDLVSDMHGYAKYYCAIALESEENIELKQAFNDLRELKVDVAYPFLLKIYHHYQQNMLTPEKMVEIVRLVESYVFRRAICSLPTNALNRIFVELGHKLNGLNQDNYLEGVQAAFLLLQSYRHFPSDEVFKHQLKERDLYNFPRRSYWLRRLENHDRNEPISVGEYSIEHIMPQNKDLPCEWQNELGPEWQRIQETWLHTLGNLTLTGYNSHYSDHSFIQKRDCKDQKGNPIGLGNSPIRLNYGLGQVQRWDEAAIQQRATRLADKAVEVWRFPSLEPEVLEAYRPQPTQLIQAYSIANFPQLTNGGATATLFKALRKEIIHLDPGVINEEFLSRYIAYKAETNFVDVVPKASGLLLYLNMPFQEIEYPTVHCRDVSSIGHWGNGDVEIKLSSQEDIPNVMGFIRQSFDRQMGNAAD